MHRSSGILFVIGASGAGRTAAVSELAFITAATTDIREMRASMVLLDCSPEVRASRLAFRAQPELASAQMDSWAAYLLGKADALSLPVVDTSAFLIVQVADVLERHVARFREEVYGQSHRAAGMADGRRIE